MQPHLTRLSTRTRSPAWRPRASGPAWTTSPGHVEAEDAGEAAGGATGADTEVGEVDG